MEERYIVTQFGAYDFADWDGENRSGWTPTCEKVLVLPDQAMDATPGGVLMADTIKDNQGAAATTGILVALGPQAFAYDSMRLVKWVGERPEPGWRVAFVKYAGQEHMGDDGKMYRMMEDRSIGLYRKPAEGGATE